MRFSPQYRPWTLLALTLSTGLATGPAFDVASIKTVPPAPGDYHADLGTASHGAVTLTNATLSQCLRFAFAINNDDQIAGPDWIKSRDVRFNIMAKAPPDTPLPELRRMLQTLLSSRFQMTIHHEDREQRFLALVIAKKGLKMHETQAESDAPGGRQIMGAIISNRMPVEQLALLLSRFLHLPVLDLTGLTGRFDVNLQWTPDNRPVSATESGDQPSIFAAVQEQLGLALEARRGPLDTIVVDRADKVPIEN